jgi:hypothetical protein
VEAESSSGMANETGDSGGPIIRVISGHVYAAGIDSASFDPGAASSCLPGHTCSTNVLYADIDDSTSELHAVLKTG